MGWMLC